MSDENIYRPDQDPDTAAWPGEAEPAKPVLNDDENEIVDFDFSKDSAEDSGSHDHSGSGAENGSNTASGTEPYGSDNGSFDNGNGGSFDNGNGSGFSGSGTAAPRRAWHPPVGGGKGQGLSADPSIAGEEQFSQEKVHVWEEEEPRFDTQTGERLDKPKAKWPGIVLSAMVLVFILGALIYAMLPGRLKDSSDEDYSLIETEPDREEDRAEKETDPAAMIIPPASWEALTEEALTEEETEEGTEQTVEMLQADTEGEISGSGLTGTAQTEADFATDETEAGTEADEAWDEAGESATDTLIISSQGSLADLVDALLPSLVSVTAAGPDEVAGYYDGTAGLDKAASCSGIIIQEDEDRLYILTDMRVAYPGTDLSVGIGPKDPGTEPCVCPAYLEGCDPATDLALLTVEKSSIPEPYSAYPQIAQIWSDEEVQVGESAAVLGNTVLYGPSVIQGSVCAAGIPFEKEGFDSSYILTDIPVNDINDGGAFVNMSGEVIGMVLKNDDDAGRALASVISFATVYKSLDRISSGQAADELAYEEESAEKMIREDSDIEAGSDAGPMEETESEISAEKADAGSGAEDTDTKEDPAKKESAAAAEPDRADPDKADPENVGAESEKINNDEEAAISAAPAADTAAAVPSGSDEEPKGGTLGVYVAEIAPERQVIDRLPAGVIIEGLLEGSAAGAAGLMVGDVIVDIDGHKITLLDDLRSAMALTAPGDKIELSYIRPDSKGKYREDRVRKAAVIVQ